MMELVPEYDPPHVAVEPCPNCSISLGVNVYHPQDRPCTIALLRVPAP